jgi:hypothetical protein
MGHHRVHTKPKHFLAVMMVHCARHCLNIYVPNIGVITCSDNFAAKNTEIRTPIWQKGATNERFSIFTNLSLYGERKSAANTFDAWHLTIRHVEVSLLNIEYGDKRVKRRGEKKKKSRTSPLQCIVALPNPTIELSYRQNPIIEACRNG